MLSNSGFVWHATFQGRDTNIDIFFGPSIRPEDQSYENLETNMFDPKAPDFLFYKNVKIMEKSRDELESGKLLLKLQKAHIVLTIANSYEEAKRLFKGKRDLIVIASNPDLRANNLIGRIVKGKPSWGVMPGAFMSYNGLVPFDDYFGAEYMSREGKRQGQCNTYITHFKIEHKT